MHLPLRQYWELLSQHIRPQRGRFALLTALMLVSIGLKVTNPQIMRFFIDTAQAGGAFEQLMLAAAGFISIALIQQVAAVSVTYLGENVAWTATNALRAELAWHCLNLDMGFHNEHTPGEMIERIDGDITELANFFSQFVVLIVSNALLLAAILAALFREDWRAGLAFTLFTGLAMFALYKVRDIAMVHQKNLRQAIADLYGFLEEQLSSTEDIRSSGAVGYSLRELYRHHGNIMRHDYKSMFKTWIINNVTGVMLTAGIILAVSSGYMLFTAGAITIGTVYLFVHYVTLLDQPIWALTHQIQNFQTIGACVERLSDLRKLQPKVQDAAPLVSLPAAGSSPARAGCGRRALGNGPLALDFQSVSFAYNDADAVLRDLTFRVEPGSVLGLLGRTGSGKSTLTRLIFRLYDPCSGCILINGHDLRAIGLQSLRRRIGVVTQEVQLFRASVRDNLTFFDRAIQDEQILTTLEDLGMLDWFHSLPNGLDTEIDAGGHSLSAGEAQLLAFGRVFLRDPGLVILDEASSRLDPATEQRIERAIDKLLCGRTAIIVAHRLSTVQRADNIMILEDGQICEYGSRAQLAADPGSRFAQLLKSGMEEVLA